MPMPTNPKPTVFISYFRGDGEDARKLMADLDGAGHACWIDTAAIQTGEEWARSIAEGINSSYALIPVITADSLESRWVQREILWAQQQGKPIFPWIVHDVLQHPGFFPLVDCQGVKLFELGYEGALRKLLAALPMPALPAALDAERAYLKRLQWEELVNTDKYTPMGGASQRHRDRAEMRAVFELLPMGRGGHRGEPRRFENAVAEIRDLRRAVLLGEPGGGKTTTIWKLAAELVAGALADPKAPIPLLVRLGKWTDAAQSLPEFIAAELGDLGPALDRLLAEKRAALLLDGLNELPTSQRDKKYPQVRRLIEQHPALLAVVSCRELDYTDDLGFHRITITPLDPLRIREFVKRYLGEETGETLFWKLAGERARNWLRRFLEEFSGKLDDPERTFWLADHLPQNVYWGYNPEDREEKDNSTWQRWIAHREQPSSLMVLARNPYMLLMLTSVYAERGELPENRGELFRLFVETLLERERVPDEEQAPLTEGLARVAYEMQLRRASEESEDEKSEALTVLPRAEAAAMLGERLLYLAGSASLLSVGEQVRFSHQLLQEYFAARFMDLEIAADRLAAASLWPPDRWWERNNWEEAAVLLAGYHGDDCSAVVEWLADAQPEVAARCATRSGAAPLPEAVAARLRAKWIPRLTDLERDPDPKARAAVGRAMGMIGGDNRRGVGVLRDSRGIDLPDIDWVEIPAGEFQYGGDEKYEGKPQRLTLPAFRIARYPITNAQFQTFLDDPAGFADPRWFEGLAAEEEERAMEAPGFGFANHPRGGVKWYQAIAFCRWLSWRLGGGYDLKKIADWAVRLPTEFEWEKAARGTDGRLYPYEGDYDPAKGNTRDTGIGPSAVGIFPNGASPYGAMDMSGNVWELCLSNYDKPAMDARKENLRTDKRRVLRGGSWADNLVVARVACRYFYHPALRVILCGFRVVG